MNPLHEFREKVTMTIGYLTSQLRCVHDGNVSAGFVETFKVPHQGQKTEVRFIATVFEDRGRICVIPFDRSTVPKVAKDLKDGGLDAYAFSKEQVAVNIPRFCGEERLKVQAHIEKLGEDSKVSIRNARKKCKQQFQGNKEEGREFEKKLQKITDAGIAEVDSVIAHRCRTLR